MDFYMLWLCSRRRGEKKIITFSVVSEMVSSGKGRRRMPGHFGMGVLRFSSWQINIR